MYEGGRGALCDGGRVGILHFLWGKRGRTMGFQPRTVVMENVYTPEYIFGSG